MYNIEQWNAEVYMDDKCAHAPILARKAILDEQSPFWLWCSRTGQSPWKKEHDTF